MDRKKFILSNLDVFQQQAVETVHCPLLIVAGPGAGKTMTVVNRIAKLIADGIAPESICALTFTNRAAKEMNQRAYDLIGQPAEKAFIGTIHLLGLKI